MFELLFKYRPVVFERGDLVLAAPAWALAAGIVLIGLGVPLLLRYRALPGVPARDRLALSALRFAALAVLLFALFRPALLVSTVVPRRNYVPVLVDDSRSMRVADQRDGTRAERALALLGGGAGPDGLLSDLAGRFRVRLYGFSSDAAPVDSAGALGFAGERTALGAALDRVRRETDGLPVSGVVVLTDGADTEGGAVGDATLALRAAGIPVYAVGLGRERIAPDVEVRRVAVPRDALRGTTLLADVILSHAGVAGRDVRLDVEDSGRILGTREVELAEDGETAVQVQFTVAESGPRRLRVRAHGLEGEAVTDNNVREMLLEVRAEPRRILYFEGRPRPELKFLRRAVEGDDDVRLVVLLRTAEEKYLRLGVEDGMELPEGFPTAREELFRYDGLVLGDVEASAFTHDQLRMIAEFVSRRGGGLLALGGRSAFAEGGYAGTPLADALPVRLDDPAGEPELAELRPRLTPAGRRHPAVRVAGDEAASAGRWDSMPPVTSVNALRELKPGAVALLDGEPAGEGPERVLLAYQRFGRGLALALSVQDSWLWQMHADVPVEDRTHETLWRQLLRWLVHDAPGRVRPDLPEEAVAPGEAVTIGAEVNDERHLRVNGARVTALVTGPDGVPSEVPLEWTVERDGEYEGRFVPPEPGLYRVELDASAPAGPPDPGAPAASSGAAPATAVGHFRAGSPEREAFDAGRRTELLRRIASETGGRYYEADEAASLAGDIGYTESGDTVTEEHPLWDMPVLFLALGMLLAGEWGWRRWRGLA